MGKEKGERNVPYAINPRTTTDRTNCTARTGRTQLIAISCCVVRFLSFPIYSFCLSDFSPRRPMMGARCAIWRKCGPMLSSNHSCALYIPSSSYRFVSKGGNNCDNQVSLAYIREIVIKKMSVKKWNPGAKEEKKRKELRTRKGRSPRWEKKGRNTIKLEVKKAQHSSNHARHPSIFNYNASVQRK